MSKYISTKTSVQNLQFANSWKYLTEKERNYAYFMSKSSWAGAKICLHQNMYEAPPMFLIF
jgi:hypothetical protein